MKKYTVDGYVEFYHAPTYKFNAISFTDRVELVDGDIAAYSTITQNLRFFNFSFVGGLDAPLRDIHDQDIRKALQLLTEGVSFTTLGCLFFGNGSFTLDTTNTKFYFDNYEFLGSSNLIKVSPTKALVSGGYLKKSIGTPAYFMKGGLSGTLTANGGLSFITSPDIQIDGVSGNEYISKFVTVANLGQPSTASWSQNITRNTGDATDYVSYLPSNHLSIPINASGGKDEKDATFTIEIGGVPISTTRNAYQLKNSGGTVISSDPGSQVNSQGRPSFFSVDGLKDLVDSKAVVSQVDIANPFYSIYNADGTIHTVSGHRAFFEMPKVLIEGVNRLLSPIYTTSSNIPGGSLIMGGYLAKTTYCYYEETNLPLAVTGINYSGKIGSFPTIRQPSAPQVMPDGGTSAKYFVMTTGANSDGDNNPAGSVVYESNGSTAYPYISVDYTVRYQGGWDFEVLHIPSADLHSVTFTGSHILLPGSVYRGNAVPYLTQQASKYIYFLDSTTFQMSIAGEFPNPLFGCSSIALPNGKVIVFGGMTGCPEDLDSWRKESGDLNPLNTVYSITTTNGVATVTSLNPTLFPHFFPALYLLGDGRILIVSGDKYEVYDPVNNLTTASGPLTSGNRYGSYIHRYVTDNYSQYAIIGGWKYSVIPFNYDSSVDLTSKVASKVTFGGSVIQDPNQSLFIYGTNLVGGLNHPNTDLDNAIYHQYDFDHAVTVNGFFFSSQIVNSNSAYNNTTVNGLSDWAIYGTNDINGTWTKIKEYTAVAPQKGKVWGVPGFYTQDAVEHDYEFTNTNAYRYYRIYLFKTAIMESLQVGTFYLKSGLNSLVPLIHIGSNDVNSGATINTGWWRPNLEFQTGLNRDPSVSTPEYKYLSSVIKWNRNIETLDIATPADTILFTVDKTSIVSGDSLTFTFDSQVTSCPAYLQYGNTEIPVTSTTLTLNDLSSLDPTIEFKFFLFKSDTVTYEKHITVNIFSISIVADSTEIFLGQSVILSTFLSSGTGVINPGNLTVSNGNNTYAVTPTGSSPVVYTLTANGVSKTVSIIINPVTMNLSPSTTNLLGGEFVDLTLDISGPQNTFTTWYVDNILGGDSDVGTLSGEGSYWTYTAGFAGGSHTIKAVLDIDHTKFATAVANVTALPRMTLNGVYSDLNLTNGSNFTVNAIFASAFTNVTLQPVGLALVSGVSQTVVQDPDTVVDYYLQWLYLGNTVQGSTQRVTTSSSGAPPSFTVNGGTFNLQTVNGVSVTLNLSNFDTSIYSNVSLHTLVNSVDTVVGGVLSPQQSLNLTPAENSVTSYYLSWNYSGGTGNSSTIEVTASAAGNIFENFTLLTGDHNSVSGSLSNTDTWAPLYNSYVKVYKLTVSRYTRMTFEYLTDTLDPDNSGLEIHRLINSDYIYRISSWDATNTFIAEPGDYFILIIGGSPTSFGAFNFNMDLAGNFSTLSDIGFKINGQTNGPVSIFGGSFIQVEADLTTYQEAILYPPGNTLTPHEVNSVSIRSIVELGPSEEYFVYLKNDSNQEFVSSRILVNSTVSSATITLDSIGVLGNTLLEPGGSTIFTYSLANLTSPSSPVSINLWSQDGLSIDNSGTVGTLSNPLNDPNRFVYTAPMTEGIYYLTVEVEGVTIGVALEVNTYTLSAYVTANLASAINVKDAPYSAYGDGIHDDTAAIQAALNATAGNERIVYIPTGTYLINASDRGIRPLSGTTIYMDSDTILKEIPGSTISYDVICLSGVERVNIVGGTILGNNGNNTFPTPTTQEDGNCIGIHSSSRIIVDGVICRDAWCDGVYIGISNQGGNVPSSNIVLANVTGNQNRRNGFSIVNGGRVVVRNCTFSNNLGSDEGSGWVNGSGVDVECNAGQHISTMLFDKCTFENNYSAGLTYGIGITTAPGSTTDTIWIQNCTSNGNGMSGYYGEYLSNSYLLNCTGNLNSILGVYNYECQGTLIKGNTITDCGAGGDDQAGIMCYNDSDTIVTENTVTGSPHYAITCYGTNNPTVTNNTVTLGGTQTVGVRMVSCTGTIINTGNIG